MGKRLAIAVIAVAALGFAPNALAAGYAFDGGTKAQQAQVKAALDASAFDFTAVPAPVTIHIRRGVDSYSTPGNVWLDADLLSAGTFAWGVVQHEYAHQVDFFLLSDALRAQLHGVLGGTGWWTGGGHDALDAERFADLVAWTYWPSTANVMKPAWPVSTPAFRAIVDRLLPQPRLLRALQAPRKG